jgi:hypothetical protein
MSSYYMYTNSIFCLSVYGLDFFTYGFSLFVLLGLTFTASNCQDKFSARWIWKDDDSLDVLMYGTIPAIA